MFKTDIPINLASEDELDRTEFSEAIAKAMISYTNTNSLIIGIDKFSGQPTSIMTVLTDKFGNLVTATPGVIK